MKYYHLSKYICLAKKKSRAATLLSTWSGADIVNCDRPIVSISNFEFLVFNEQAQSLSSNLFPLQRIH